MTGKLHSRWIMATSILIVVTFAAWHASATGFYSSLVKDIGQFDISSTPMDFVDFNGVVYFSANDSIHGSEVWKSDGTPGGTVLLKDLVDGPVGSNPHQFAATNTHVFFAANADGGAFEELWKSDGTPGGTVLVKDINPFGASSVRSIMSAGNKVFFAAEDGVHGHEPWVSDGTDAGTFMLKDINPGGGESNPQSFTLWDGIVYFAATDPIDGRELWRSDGTVDGTYKLKDIYEGVAPNMSPRNGNPQSLTATPGALFFSAQTAAGAELWKTDGTSDGTVQVRDISPGSGSSLPRDMVNLNGLLLFVANGPGGQELWRSDGSFDGTVRVKDIMPGGAGSSAESLAAAGDLAFFRANDGESGVELWVSDGTEQGTVLAADIVPGDGSSQPTEMQALDHRIVFKADTPASGEEVWISDGSPGGTFLLRDIREGMDGSDPFGFTRSGGRVFFRANDGFSGDELWSTDGTPGGTDRVKVINETASGSDAGGLFTWNGATYFFANDGMSGSELWKSDGTSEGTEMVRDIRPGLEASFPTEFTPFDGVLYFAATGPANGRELWKTDGSFGNTVEVADIRTGAQSSSPAFLTVLGNRLLYVADDGTHGPEWWKTEIGGASERISDIAPGTGDPAIAHPAVLGNLVLFAANDGTTGNELWKTDGTLVGTEQVKDIHANAEGSDPQHLTPFGAMVLFSADDGIDGAELWRSNGAEGGTSKVRAIRDGIVGSNPRDFTVVGDNVFFAADDGVHGTELWKTDGNFGGTALVADVFPGPNGSNPAYLTEMNGLLYFAAQPDGLNRELWVSDGSEGGTMQVAEIRDGSNGSFPEAITALNGRVYFSAIGGPFITDTGRELWASDGTQAGTRRVEDIFAGATPSFPANMTLLGERILFTADNGFNGNELWSAEPGAPVVTQFQPVGPLETNANEVQFSVMFSRAVTGVDVTDFEPVTNSKQLNGAFVASVIGSGSNYTVSVNTGAGSGTLGLRLLDDDSIQGAVSPALPLAGPGGNDATMSTAQHYSIDKVSPVITVMPLATRSFSPPLSGTVDDPSASVTVEVNGQVVVPFVLGSDWSIPLGTFANLPEGIYDVLASAEDAAGNVGTDTTENELTIDVTGPVLTLVGNAFVQVFIGDTYVELGAVAVDNLDPAPMVFIEGDVVDDGAEGMYTVVYRAEDAAGNIAAPITRTVNVTLPSGGASGQFTPGQVFQLFIQTGPLSQGFLQIPPDAIQAPVFISIDYANNPPPLPPGWRLILAATVTPDGLELLAPADLRIPYAAPVDDPPVRVAYFHTQNNRWQTDGVTLVEYSPINRWVTFSTTWLGVIGLFLPGGDVNGDNRVDAVDIQLVINTVLGFPAIGIDANVDNDPDGLVDAIDVQLTINQALGLF